MPKSGLRVKGFGRQARPCSDRWPESRSGPLQPRAGSLPPAPPGAVVVPVGAPARLRESPAAVLTPPPGAAVPKPPATGRSGMRTSTYRAPREAGSASTRAAAAHLTVEAGRAAEHHLGAAAHAQHHPAAGLLDRRGDPPEQRRGGGVQRADEPACTTVAQAPARTPGHPVGADRGQRAGNLEPAQQGSVAGDRRALAPAARAAAPPDGARTTRTVRPLGGWESTSMRSSGGVVVDRGLERARAHVQRGHPPRGGGEPRPHPRGARTRQAGHLHALDGEQGGVAQPQPVERGRGRPARSRPRAPSAESPSTGPPPGPDRAAGPRAPARPRSARARGGGPRP